MFTVCLDGLEPIQETYECDRQELLEATPSDQTGSETKNHTSQALELAAGSCAGSLSRALLITH